MDRASERPLTGDNSVDIFNASPVPALLHDPQSGTILDANEASVDLFGYDVEELRGMDVAEFSPSVEDASEQAAAAFEAAMAEGSHALDWEITDADGSRATVRVTLRPVTVGTDDFVAAFVTDVTESRKRERVLDELHDVATALMDADSRAEVADLTTSAAEDVIDFSFAAVRLLRDDRLEMVSMTTDTEEILHDEPDPFDVGEGFVGAAFEAGDPRIVDDLPATETNAAYGHLHSAICIPMGRHGVMNVGGERPGQFDESDIEFAKLLTRLTESALDQVERENRLAERTDQLETLVNNAPVIFYELDPEGTITVSRGRALEGLGLEPGEAVGNSMVEMYSDLPAVQEVVRRALDGEAVSKAVRVGDQWFDNTFQPIVDEDGEVERVTGIAVDITDLKSVEEQFAALSESAISLAERESPAAAIDEAIAIAERVLDNPEAAYWQADHEDERLVATSLTVSAGQSTDDPSSIVHEADSPVWQAFDRGEPVLNNEFDAEMATEAAQLGSVVLAPVGDHGLLSVGEPDHGAFGERDRYLLSILGGLLRTTLDRLGYEAALEANRVELERSNESLQQFAYVASHDLQEPLRMVSSYVSLLEQEYGDDLEGEAEQYMEYATDGARRMQEMIDALLEYSRVHTQGKEFSPVDTTSVLEETLQGLELLLDETDATVDYEELPPVEADRSQLGQIFQNLVKNAIHHAEGSPTVEIRARDDEERIHIAVADDGPGIEVDQQDRIFEIFKQNSSQRDSTGIGLAMCKRIVNRHGGDIRVDSEPGEGATFRFSLPAATADPAEVTS